MDHGDREASASLLADTKQAGGKRRRWPEELKREVVAALAEPGASVSSVARRYDLNTNQLFKWRRRFAAAGTPSVEPARLLPVEIAPARASTVEERSGSPPLSSASPTGSIEIALRGGTKVRIKGMVDPAAVAAAIGAVLAPRRRR
ncbi:MAG: transposase [Geminicoccaceae bacterium]